MGFYFRNFFNKNQFKSWIDRKNAQKTFPFISLKNSIFLLNKPIQKFNVNNKVVETDENYSGKNLCVLVY